MTMMTMMKAARFHEYGGTSVIRYEAVARPRPASGEVLLRVAATSFNPTEAALRAGLLHAFLPVDLPYTPGWDVAGTEAVRRQGADRVIDYTAEPAADAGVSAMHMVARNDVAQLAALVGLVDTAALGIDISASHPLADLADVHRLSEAGRTRGKVIIIP
ncbi:zinc-binding dehydrogenase [Kitasatospora sp. NPDC058162]|uniref:zinc-binding dehydrogenase n=1 Tax=Kitasatospora sp. NPDC058162 TaxID=3346362 RepID=UPI0036DD644A